MSTNPLLFAAVVNAPANSSGTEASAPVLARQDPDLLQVPRDGIASWYDHELIPDLFRTSYPYLTYDNQEYMTPESPTLEAVDPDWDMEDTRNGRQSSMDSHDSSTGSQSQDSQGSGSQNSNTDSSEAETQIDQTIEAPEHEWRRIERTPFHLFAGHRLIQQTWANSVRPDQPLLVPENVPDLEEDDGQGSILSFETYTLERGDEDPLSVPPSATPTATSHRKRRSESDPEDDRGEGPSSRPARSGIRRRSSVTVPRRASIPYHKKRRTSESQ